MSDNDVKWFTLGSDDAEDYIGDICDTREEAIEQGRAEQADEFGQIDPGVFWVCKGNRVQESEIAAWIVGCVESAFDDQTMETDLELGGDDPLVEPTRTDYDALSAVVEAWLKERELLRAWYRWEPSERINP